MSGPAEGTTVSDGAQAPLVFAWSVLSSTRHVVELSRGDTVIYSDTLNLLSAKHRERFAAALHAKTKEPPARLQAQLLRLANEVHRYLASGDDGPSADKRQGLQGTALEITPPEPWSQPVELIDALNDFADLLRRHVVMGQAETVACVLWTAFTHAVDSFDVAGYLVVQSPTRRCGKTTLARLSAAAACKPLYAASVAPAALFRVIEKAKPAFFLDECDAYLAGNEELRGLLNAGVTRDEAYVVRCVGDDFEPRKFSVFGPKLLAGIGRLPPTVEDRAFIVRLQRRAKGEKIDRLTRASLAQAGEIGRRFYRWYLDHRGEIQADADPPIPESLNDRQGDVWRPLLVLADAAGGPWPELARRAAVALSAEGVDTDELPIRFLADAAAALQGYDEISAADLAERLGADVESPWATYARGKPISPEQVGRLLGRFGIKPTKRHGRRTYEVGEIAAACERYCPKTGEVTAPTAPDDPSPNAAMTYEGAVGAVGGSKAEATAPHLSPNAAMSYGDGGSRGSKWQGVRQEKRLFDGLDGLASAMEGAK